MWIAYDRDRGQGCAFWLGSRDREACSQLFKQLNCFEVLYFCTDDYPAYREVLPKDKHVITKSETCAIEGFNLRVRHYLARFHRRTFCYSKALHMVYATLTTFFTANWEIYL
ncbi:MAG: IS1 family transposase [Simkania sp.]|nr:IS1 family transposase [Simkania sp.]